jgi:N-acetylglucosamine kinase-like BadF-type ATPase
MTGKRLYLGVDGGGTKTEFLCIDDSRAVVARTTTGTTYHPQVGLEGAVERLREGVNAVCDALAIAPADIAYAFFGLPGFGEHSLIDPQLDAACGTILGHDRYACANDMVCGWAGSLAGEDGINLVAGTGSIGYGERQGLSARVGGWSEVFGDEGSAYWIAIQGLNAFSRMSDGRLIRGALHGAFRRALDLSSDLDICALVVGERGMTRDQIAGLAPVVSEAAQAGDPIAQGILQQAGEEIADLAVTLRTMLGYGSEEPALLSWSGGVLTHEPLVREHFQRRLGTSSHFELIEPRHAPSVGAALQAMRLNGASKPDPASRG